MKLLRLAILAFAAFVAMGVHGQLFHPLGLGIETSNEMVADYYQPQMHIEGDILYVCTKQGLYSKDLNDEGSAWKLVGFEGVPLQDYARSGDGMLALRHRYYYHNNDTILLLSHDDGETYENITPESFNIKSGNHYSSMFLTFEQHPANPNTLLTSYSMFQTTDFGKTWDKLTNMTPEYMGFHPLNPDIIYEAGGGEHTDDQNDFRISYDGGQTWQNKTACFPKYNSVFRVAFHPTDPDKWIAGGWGRVYITNDNGQTWNTQYPDSSTYTNLDYVCPWRYAIYDNENASIVYTGGSHNGYLKIMCSKDGGKTWNKPFLEPIKTTPYDFVFDMKQYGDKLLVYSQSDVYEISKAELLAQGATSVQSIVQPTTEDGALYDLSGRKISAEANSSFFTLHSSLKRGIYIEGGKKKVK